ncbi:MAG: hypothetical protein IPK22_18780 [Verrucomicrobiaceae bacterium]|nr:hypothetical protein [Verrucomicrobiaceae bacterium]
MRRPWIKIEVSTPDKPEICAIATKLRIDSDAVVGKLVRLWSWAELNGAKPNDLNVTKEFLDKLCGRKGFTEAVIQAGWLLESGNKLAFPNFDRHNGNASKVRGLTARRVEQHRVRKGKTNAPIVTKKTKRTKPEPVEEASNAQFPNDANPVVKEETMVVTVAETAETTPPSIAENLTSSPLVERVEAVATPPPPEEGLDVTEATEEKPKKKRSKVTTLDDEQPMLF